MVTLDEASGTRSLTQLYVDLDLNVNLRREAGRGSDDRTFRASQMLRTSKSYVLLGDSGAGKTTTAKKLALDVLAGRTDRQRLPIVLRLRELGMQSRLVDALLGITGLVVEAKSSGPEQVRKIEITAVAHFLGTSRATVLLDGLDELSPSRQGPLIEELQKLTRTTRGAQFILTSRGAGFRYALDGFTILELAELDDDQVRQVALRRLPDRADAFLQELAKNTYFGTRIRPLTLVHLCEIYRRRGRLPDTPRSVYELIVRLLLEDWDASKPVQRISRYGRFEVNRKAEFLESVAFHLTMKGVRGRFSHSGLREVYLEICSDFELPRSQVQQVAREIESHTGLIFESGRGFFEFFHLSVQEYLTANYVVKGSSASCSYLSFNWPVPRTRSPLLTDPYSTRSPTRAPEHAAIGFPRSFTPQRS